jgi:hypothetical protein
VRKTTIALVCAGALLLAACGDDDVDDAEDTTEDTADDDAAPDDADDEAAPAADTEFCQAIQGVDDRYADEPPAADPEEAADQMEEVLSDLRDIDPPSEIEEEWDTYLEALEAFTQIDLTDPEAAAEELDFAEMQGAIQRVEQYIREECGIGPDQDQ